MKPCAMNRKDIALLAMDALEIEREQELRAHLVGCDGCRDYLKEIANVAGTLRAAEPESGGHPSAAFHRNVMEALAARPSGSAGQRLLIQISSFLNGRLALPAVTAVALVLVAWWATAPRFGKPAPVPVVARAVAAPELKADLAPTISNYEIAVHQSLDKLDELLTAQANMNPAPLAIYSNAWPARLNAAE